MAVGVNLYFLLFSTRCKITFFFLPSPFSNGCIHNLTSGNAVIYSFMGNAFWKARRRHLHLQSICFTWRQKRIMQGVEKVIKSYWATMALVTFK